MPCSSRYRITPSAAASPYAEPPANTIALIGLSAVVGSAGVRPDAAMGYEACEDAKANHPRSGNTGAGCGATVGKLCGMERASSQGLAFMRYDLADWRWQQ